MTARTLRRISLGLGVVLWSMHDAPAQSIVIGPDGVPMVIQFRSSTANKECWQCTER